jgi:hypothetical protein
MVDTKRSFPAADYLEAGRSLVEAGYFTEGLDFLKIAKNREEILKIEDEAVEEGDFFLYSLATQMLGTQIDPTKLTRLAENAGAKGLNIYQRKALELLERQEAPDE